MLSRVLKVNDINNCILFFSVLGKFWCVYAAEKWVIYSERGVCILPPQQQMQKASCSAAAEETERKAMETCICTCSRPRYALHKLITSDQMSRLCKVKLYVDTCYVNTTHTLLFSRPRGTLPPFFFFFFEKIFPPPLQPELYARSFFSHSYIAI